MQADMYTVWLLECAAMSTLRTAEALEMSSSSNGTWYNTKDREIYDAEMALVGRLKDEAELIQKDCD